MPPTITNKLITFAIKMLLKFRPPPQPKVFRGEGSVEKLTQHIANGDLKSIFLVTTEGMIKRGKIEPITSVFKEKGINVELFTDVPPNPTLDVVEKATALCLENGCGAVYAYGGGSVIDAAKGIAAQAGTGVPISKLLGTFELKQDALPLYAIPSTSGSGSEVSNAAVLSSPKSHQKLFLLDHKIVPLAVALDPTTTADLPKALTAATGMDALTHAIESHISRVTDKKAEELSSSAVASIFKHLPTAYEEGDNLEARLEMATAAYDAGVAFTRTGLGFVHAISHQLTAHYEIPHGVANAAVLPYVLRFSKSNIISKLAGLARTAGVGNATDSNESLADRFIEEIRNLSRDLGIPTAFPQIKEEDIPKITAKALKEATYSFAYPKSMNSDDCAAILMQIKEGRF